jgi:hypothetical protein
VSPRKGARADVCLHRVRAHTKERSAQRGHDGKMITQQNARRRKGNVVTGGTNHRISNSEIPRLETYLTPAISMAKTGLIAKICDFCRSAFSLLATAASAISNWLCCRLEFAVTPCKQTTARISNRRKPTVFAFLQNSSPLATRRRSCYSESSNLPQHLTLLSKQTERLAPRFRFASSLQRRNSHGYRSNAQDL